MCKGFAKTRLFLFALLLMLAVALPSFAEEPDKTDPSVTSQQGKKYITMNFRDVDLTTLIKFISDLTGRNFLVDPAVKGQVTILSPSKVTMDEAYRVFLSVLEVHGFTIVEAGKVTKIIPSAAARTKGMGMQTGSGPDAREDRIITQLVPLKVADPDFLAKILTPLVEKTGVILPYPETRTLILIDTQSNVSRLLRIIRELDVPGDEDIRVFQLQNAGAEDLAKQLLTLFEEKGKQAKDSTQRMKMVADPRTNSVVVRAGASDMAGIRMLVETLDLAKVTPRENVHLYHLQHAEAETLAKVLTELPSKAAKDSKDKAATPSPFSKDIQIYADKATNNLIIVAKPEEYQVLEEIIRKLDMPRTMVYVEALIMEVSATKALDLGVEWRVGNIYDGGYGAGKDGGVWFGGSTRGSGSSSGGGDLDGISSGKVSPGFVAGVIGRGITLGNIVFPTVAAFVKAVRTDSDFNVISTPQILTLDNEEASIEVGQNIPFVSRVDQGTSTTDRAIQSFQYKDVGVTLKVTPQISHAGTVRLKVEESVKSVISQTAEGGYLAPTTTYRTAKTTISIKDGETAVIGGLIENRLNRGSSQTPCLGGIPGLGWLFKSVSDQDDKTNLLVFLTPHIVESPEEAEAIYRKKREGIDREAGRAEEKREKDFLRKKGFEE
ncbi:MAG: type II secretion system secretin GspD [Deltaproteobacteria bacterium]|nr:type II secretion system secretin GspD [Deltaproteobacteria bacterium]